MIVISDNRMVGLRANPDTWPYSDVPWVPGDGCLDNLLAQEQRGWWGPEEDHDVTPNLLAHELVHVFGQSHGIGPTEILDSAIPDRVLVGKDLDDCLATGMTQAQCDALNVGRRGYRMDIPEIPGVTGAVTTEQACANAVNSPFTQ
jgi:hypothetical protein